MKNKPLIGAGVLLLLSTFLCGCATTANVANAGKTATNKIRSDAATIQNAVSTPSVNVPLINSAAADIVTQTDIVDTSINTLADTANYWKNKWNTSYLAGKGRFWVAMLLLAFLACAVVSAICHAIAAGVDPESEIAAVMTFIGHLFGIFGQMFGGIVNRFASWFKIKKVQTQLAVAQTATLVAGVTPFTPIQQATPYVTSPPP